MKTFIHGNTYYSHAHPPEELDRNFKKMADLGMNAVRVAEVWPGWSVIEHTPGKYDYGLLDDYVEKAVKNGIKVCMGIGINDTPFWLFTRYEDLRSRNYDGRRATRRIHSACFDHSEYREHMGMFIEDITRHYSKVDGIFNWQFGNEIRYGVQYCDCPATRLRFRRWLRDLYKDNLEMLNNEWGTYYHSWDEIYPYKSYDGAPTEGIAPHCIKTLQFQNWSVEELVSWGVNIMKRYTSLPIFHNNFGHSGANGSHWKLSDPCDVTAIDIYAATYGNPGIYNGFMLDAAGSISKQQGKELWIAETSAGQYGTFERRHTDQRLIENCVMEQVGAGASAVFYFRHKAPVWEQPHKFTGSQTFLRIDESEMKYADTSRNVAAFMNRYEERILSSKPVEAKVGIYYPSESISFGKEAGYFKDSLESAFGSRAVWSGAQIPVEILDTDGMSRMDLSQFKIIHIPVSYLLPSCIGNALRGYVKAGGTLICEGRPGYVNENGLLHVKQPGGGLDEIFGAAEDLFYNCDSYTASIKLQNFSSEVRMPAAFKQTYRLQGGKAFIETEEGEICGVRNFFGKGAAYIFGGAPSLHYRIGAGKYQDGKKSAAGTETYNQRRLFCKLFEAIGVSHGVNLPVKFTGGSTGLTVRYLENDNEVIMFCINYSEDEEVKLTLDEKYHDVMELKIIGESVLKDRTVVIPGLSWSVISVVK